MEKSKVKWDWAVDLHDQVQFSLWIHWDKNLSYHFVQIQTKCMKTKKHSLSFRSSKALDKQKMTRVQIQITSAADVAAQGDPERRNSSRNVSPLDSVLWLANLAAVPPGRPITALNQVGWIFGNSSSSHGFLGI